MPARSAESTREKKHHDSAEITRPDLGTVAAYPGDLAREVRRRLKEGQKEHGPPTAVLTHLFEVLHFASMRTEEGQP
ncbi:MAG: hypothetical protein ACAI25_12270, partial [Planctomycetota bacterium]